MILVHDIEMMEGKLSSDEQRGYELETGEKNRVPLSKGWLFFFLSWQCVGSAGLFRR